jgi:peptidoglycan/LPS O-acetylase OafA/YrhL
VSDPSPLFQPDEDVRVSSYLGFVVGLLLALCGALLLPLAGPLPTRLALLLRLGFPLAALCTRNTNNTNNTFSDRQ